ncbi:MAG: hypothetical protein H0X40_03770 [Chthoniobacterales bacterium]|nr:hypothetical protein [Chthoniobacterales bacterium]
MAYAARAARRSNISADRRRVRQNNPRGGPGGDRNEVLPNECRKRVAIEAGVPEIWSQYGGGGEMRGARPFFSSRLA